MTLKMLSCIFVKLNLMLQHLLPFSYRPIAEKSQDNQTLANQKEYEPISLQLKETRMNLQKHDKLHNISKLIRQQDVKILQLYDSHDPMILKSISCIELPCLQLLDLQGNQIESIECLAWINLEHLQTLNLSHNNITCIKSFRKSNCSKLKKLHIANNYIHDSVTYIQEHDSHLKQVILNFSFDDHPQVHDLTVIACKMKGECDIVANCNPDWKYRRIQQHVRTIRKNTFTRPNI